MNVALAVLALLQLIEQSRVQSLRHEAECASGEEDVRLSGAPGSRNIGFCET
jgi:hypothetical protein